MVIFGLHLLPILGLPPTSSSLTTWAPWVLPEVRNWTPDSSAPPGLFPASCSLDHPVCLKADLNTNCNSKTIHTNPWALHQRTEGELCQLQYREDRGHGSRGSFWRPLNHVDEDATCLPATPHNCSAFFCPATGGSRPG